MQLRYDFQRYLTRTREQGNKENRNSSFQYFVYLIHGIPKLELNILAGPRGFAGRLTCVCAACKS